jgi:4-aminobutyrate aminotransferase
VSYIHGSYKLRSPWRDRRDAEYVEAAVADLEDVLGMMASGNVACLIAEPIQGVGGFATPPDGLYGALGEVLDRHGILLIADEVQTGWGRTGEHFWGIEAHGVVPDIMTFAKGVANGVAMGGVVARAEVMNCLGANSISTFGGNPVASAAALANVRYIVDNDLQSNAREMGRRLRDRLDALAEQTEAIVEVRGKGLMQAIEIVVPGGLVPDAPAVARVMEDARSAGLIIGRGGSLGNVLRVAPPLCVTEEEVDEASRILEEIFAQQG